MRKDRNFDQLRDVTFETNVNLHAEGSCLVKFGNTHVMCTASIDEKTPPWLRNSGKGWVTAEYGMLPRSTNTRIDREAARGKQSGRTQEIQRLIGRSLRSVTNLQELGERQIKIDCDVIQADGGTRTASISGGFVALYQAIEKLKKNKPIVVSMGNVAASGGYYIACNANKILANPMTITGSIGVWGTLPNLEGISSDIGINAEQVNTHKNSMASSPNVS